MPLYSLIIIIIIIIISSSSSRSSMWKNSGVSNITHRSVPNITHSENTPEPDRQQQQPKHVVDFFNNFKIQLCYDGHLYT
jgi:hypothetical protein